MRIVEPAILNRSPYVCDRSVGRRDVYDEGASMAICRVGTGWELAGRGLADLP